MGALPHTPRLRGGRRGALPHTLRLRGGRQRDLSLWNPIFACGRDGGNAEGIPSMMIKIGLYGKNRAAIMPALFFQPQPGIRSRSL